MLGKITQSVCVNTATLGKKLHQKAFRSPLFSNALTKHSMKAFHATGSTHSPPSSLSPLEFINSLRFAVRKSVDLTKGFQESPLVKNPQPLPHHVVFMGKTASTAIKDYLTLVDPDTILPGSLLVAKEGQPLPPNLPETIEVVYGNHPVPGPLSAIAQQRLEYNVGKFNAPTQFFVSGGTSALTNYSPLLSKIRSLLLQSGNANISHLNVVSRDLGRIAGGGLLNVVQSNSALDNHPIDICVASDVADNVNVLSDIGSGPLHQNPTPGESYALLEKLGLLERLTPDEQDVLANLASDSQSTPPISSSLTSPCLPHRIIASLDMAAQGALNFLTDHGYHTQYLPEALTDHEARDIGAKLLLKFLKLQQENPGHPIALVATGEPLVTILNPEGKGGRARETALGSLSQLKEIHLADIPIPHFLGCSVATDGDDGPWANGISGGWFTHLSALEAVRMGLYPDDFLAANDSGRFFNQMGQSLGPLDPNSCPINVRDYLILASFPN